MQRHAFVLVTPDQAEQVLAQDFEDHADMDTIWPAMAEVVEELNDMAATRMSRRRVRGDDALEQLYFINRGLCVAGSGLDDLEGDMAVVPAGRRVVSNAFVPRWGRRTRQTRYGRRERDKRGLMALEDEGLTEYPLRAKQWRNGPSLAS